MSVAVPVIDYIDGSARRIYLLQGVDAFHWIEDIYREYVDRRANNEDFRKWSPLLRAAGNDPKGGGKFTPRYVTLLDGCRVVPYDENILIVVSGEAITDNADIDPDPFDTTTRVNPLKLYITPPAAEIVKDVESLAAIAQMSFNGEVWHDHDIGHTLAEHIALGRDPVLFGNAQYAVKDSTEAYDVSVAKRIKKIRMTGAHSLIADINMTGYIIHGDSAVNDALDAMALPNILNVTFQDLTLSGTMDGGSTVRECLIAGLNFFNGIAHNCAFTTIPVALGGTGTAMFLDCYSAVAGGNDRPTIDFDGEPTNLAVRGWLGGLELINKTNATGDVSIDISSGTLYIRSSCTAGEITVRGNGILVDESGAGCIVLSRGLTNNEVIAEHVWEYER